MHRNNMNLQLIYKLLTWCTVIPLSLASAIGTLGTLSSCDNKTTIEHTIADKSVNVLVSSDENSDFKEKLFNVEYNGDLVIDLQLKDGFVFEKCNYDHYFIEKDGTLTKLHLQNLRFDTKIKIDTVRATGMIRYHANGGTLYIPSSEHNGDYYEESVNETYHLRANTSIGVNKLSRDGHTFLGWNTKADESGEHVGGGSRIKVGDGNHLELYAEWSEWTDPALFSYTLNTATQDPDDITITSYSGKNATQTLSIPAELGGKKVTALSEGAISDFTNGKTLVLPPTMYTISLNAFNNCNFEEIYFFDNLIELKNESFGFLPKTVHINAVQAPAYSTGDEASQFADKMDRLILNADKKKLILFGGCSVTYGINSELLQKAYPDYVVCNMAAIGGITPIFQMEIMSKYMNSNDVFIHAPEPISPYQLFNYTYADPRFFNCVESNYDLLSLADLSNTEGFFTAFESFNILRNKITMRYTYADRNFQFNEYGDISTYRRTNVDNAVFDLEEAYCLSYLNAEAFAIMNQTYEILLKIGIRVMFSFGPINSNAISESEKEIASWDIFDELIRANIHSSVKVISYAGNYIFGGSYFYDTDYHLTTDGADIRTQLLISDIGKL